MKGPRDWGTHPLSEHERATAETMLEILGARPTLHNCRMLIQFAEGTAAARGGRGPRRPAREGGGDGRR